MGMTSIGTAGWQEVMPASGRHYRFDNASLRPA
ncbi:hypothetical protein WJ66_02295 [Stenotrophomonas maltophilia WJ66]|nr:hypothetical protein WJ66_02295 [Stenotrophomonas maltophilia WJ66]